MSSVEVVTHCLDETIELGRVIGTQLRGGEIVGLFGALGSGKTHLIKGIAAGAGAEEPDKINSPTFVIVNEYHGVSANSMGLDIYHIDAYRLKSVAEFEMLGFDDYCDGRSVVLIEWADKVEAVLENVDFIRIELSHLGPTERKIRIANMPGHIEIHV